MREEGGKTVKEQPRKSSLGDSDHWPQPGYCRLPLPRKLQKVPKQTPLGTRRSLSLLSPAAFPSPAFFMPPPCTSQRGWPTDSYTRTRPRMTPEILYLPVWCWVLPFIPLIAPPPIEIHSLREVFWASKQNASRYWKKGAFFFQKEMIFGKMRSSKDK